MKQILAIVHQETSNPGLVGQKLQARGYQLDIRCPALGDALPPNLKNHDATVVFGGPMSANDDIALPFIRTELDWLAIALTAAKPYLGICLGAQLLARALGGTVAPHPAEQREIGYYDMAPTPQSHGYFASPMKVYQWHYEGFTIPQGAVQLATGHRFPNQAFVYGDFAVGLQFHPEMTTQLIDEWTTRGADQLDAPGAYPRARHFQDHQQYGPTVDRWLDNFLNVWLSDVTWQSHKTA